MVQNNAQSAGPRFFQNPKSGSAYDRRGQRDGREDSLSLSHSLERETRVRLFWLDAFRVFENDASVGGPTLGQSPRRAGHASAVLRRVRERERERECVCVEREREREWPRGWPFSRARENAVSSALESRSCCEIAESLRGYTKLARDLGYFSRGWQKNEENLFPLGTGHKRSSTVYIDFSNSRECLRVWLRD